jgi:hypothetical protein
LSEQHQKETAPDRKRCAVYHAVAGYAGNQRPDRGEDRTFKDREITTKNAGLSGPRRGIIGLGVIY